MVESKGGRAERIARLGTDVFDLLVVGGGITGAGIARDAQQRGLRVALVDKSDYAFGTSSRSSRLVHGGLRYLENLEFGLVFESLRERHGQRKMNPNLVEPVPFVFPVFRGEKPSLGKMSLGLWLYDILALFRTHRLHRRLSAARLRKMVPGIVSNDLAGGIHYYDCQTNDARLTLANVLAAERDGAVVTNYVAFETPVVDDDGVISGATCRDELDGEAIHVRARHVVYAVGPWTDKLLQSAPGEELLRPTKGVHIVLPADRLPVEVVLVMKAPRDGRVVFVVPWGRHVYVGTTDTDHEGPADSVMATPGDVDYLLETANAFFPSAGLASQDVLGSWAGLRPLVRTGESSAYKTSREHELWSDPRGITTIAGGKLTTYRSMAEEVVDSVVKVLGAEVRRCVTAKTPLDPMLDRRHVLGEDLFSDTLWRFFGGSAPWIRERMEAFPDERERLLEDAEHVLAEVSWAVIGEHAERLQDVLVRRLCLGFEREEVAIPMARRVAAHMAKLLGKNEAWVDDEVCAFALSRTATG